VDHNDCLGSSKKRTLLPHGKRVDAGCASRPALAMRALAVRALAMRALAVRAPAVRAPAMRAPAMRGLAMRGEVRGVLI
jgi:hypothetical protein